MLYLKPATLTVMIINCHYYLPAMTCPPLMALAVAFLSVTNKTKIRSPHCTTVCLGPHSAIIYIIYDLTDDTPVYLPASSPSDLPPMSHRD